MSASPQTIYIESSRAKLTLCRKSIEKFDETHFLFSSPSDCSTVAPVHPRSMLREVDLRPDCIRLGAPRDSLDQNSWEEVLPLGLATEHFHESHSPRTCTARVRLQPDD